MTGSSSILFGTSIAALVVGVAGTAEAGVEHAPGGVRVRGGFSAHAHAGWSGSVQIGYRPYYAYPSYYYYQPVPSYYGVYSVDAGAAPGVTAVFVPPPPPLRFGFGLFAGGLATTNETSSGTSFDTQSSDYGLLGRFRLTTGLVLEGEVGKTKALSSTSVYSGDYHRVDRRVGASLLYEIGAYNRWAPYILGGLGAERTDVGGYSGTTHGYAEIGGGIRVAITRHLHLTAVLRVGGRGAESAVDTPVPAVAARTIYPEPTPTRDTETENYVRSRFAAILCF